MTSTAGSRVAMTRKSPQPTSGTSLRIRMMRSIQFSIELGSRRCLATLTCSNPYGPFSMTGEHDLSLSVKPACGPVAAQQRGQAAANTAVVELHILVGTELLEHQVSLRLGQPAEIEFVVIAQEQPPLRGGGAGFRRHQRLGQGPRIGGRHGIEQMLVDVEIEHHLYAVAILAEIF